MMPKWLKINSKIFSYVLVTLICFFTVNAHANPLQDGIDAINCPDGKCQEGWFNNGTKAYVFIGADALLDLSNAPPEVLEGKKPTTMWIPGGAIGRVNQAVAMTFTPAASGVEYIAQTWNNFLGKPAYAQNNTGFVGLQPILPIWRGFRNIVYVLSSLVFIIIGIMIMLRVKISPQAVITVQNAIPQLITTLILVTFSYAIAGLLIDLMNLIQGAILTALFAASGKSLTENLLTPNLLAGSDYATLNNMNLLTTFAIATKNIALWAMILIGGIVGGIIGHFAAPFIPVSGALGAGIGAILFVLVIAIILFINILKFFIGLIKVYIAVIFKIVLAPLEIGLGAFPGSKQGFSSWIFELIGNLAVFPVSIFVIVIINYVAELSSGTLWAPSMINEGNFVGFVIAFGGFLILAKIPEMIPQVFFNIKPSPFGQAASQGLAELQAAPGQAFNKAQQIGESAYALANFGRAVKKGGNIKAAARMQLDQRYQHDYRDPTTTENPPRTKEDPVNNDYDL